MAGNDVTITVKTKGTKQAKKAFKEVEKSSLSLKKAAIGLGVAMGAQQLVRSIGAAVSRAEDMNSAYAITEQVIKQTGGAANLTAEQIKQLSAEQTQLTGVNKLLVTQGNNVLLTFKNLRDEAGAGNDVFTRTSASMLDMAAVMGTDAKSAAVQLGKALNDPIANLGALGRAGVQFTKAQKAAIKTMIETGDLLGAQKIILKEIESQFGGAAEASADSSAKIRNALLEVQEAVGNALLPALDALVKLTLKLAPLLEKTLTPSIAKVTDQFVDVVDIVTSLTDEAESLTGTLGGLGFDFGIVGDAAGMILNPVGGAIDALTNWAEITGVLKEETVEAVGILDRMANGSARMGLAAAQAAGHLPVLSDGMGDIGEAAEKAAPSIDSMRNALEGWNSALFTASERLRAFAQAGGDPNRLADIDRGLLPPGAVGALAHGGRVQAGVPYLVGEVGTELFIPDAAGTVISSRDLASLLTNTDAFDDAVLDTIARAKRNGQLVS